MAEPIDPHEPATCLACGSILPEGNGKGRKREYCDATCRSAARRRREATRVKNNLTSRERHEYLHDVGTSGPSRPATGSTSEDSTSEDSTTAGGADRLAGALARIGSGPPLAALTAARDLAAAASETLQQAVDQARAAGHSWREIGDVLGTSRQAAFQRFGHPVDPRTGAPMSADVAPGRTEQAVEIFTCLTEGRWEDARRDFAAKMSAALDAVRLARGWAVTASHVGAYQGMGEPLARRVDDNTVVEIPLRFEAGDATGRVIFDEDAKVVGLWLRP